MKIKRYKSQLLKGTRTIALPHLFGLLVVLALFGLFAGGSKILVLTGQTMVDMRGFQLEERFSGTENRYLATYSSDAAAVASGYFLAGSDKRHLDLAVWDIAGLAWKPQLSSVEADSTDSSTITFNLPPSEKQYYIYTFGGAFTDPPAGWDSLFQGFIGCDTLQINLDYTLAEDLDSLSFYIQQYDLNQRVDSRSWPVAAGQGRHSFSRYVEVLPSTVSFRLYWRFVNPNANRITFNSVEIRGNETILSNVEYNFKKLAFDLELDTILNNPGFLSFKKSLDSRPGYDNLYFFASVDYSEIEPVFLSDFWIKAYFDDRAVWASTLDRIGEPTFVAQKITHLNQSPPAHLMLKFGCDSTTRSLPADQAGQTINIAIEYLDVR